MASQHQENGTPPLPISQPANHQNDALSNLERNNLDYVTGGDFCKCAAEDQQAVFLLEDVIAKVIDFIKANTLTYPSTDYTSSNAHTAICVNITYDHDKTAAATATAVISSSVEARIRKSCGGVMDSET